MLDALTAEKVFGWKSVHKHGGSLVGKTQDRAGHWRLAKVPYFSTHFLHAYAIVGRIKDLGLLDRYQKELAKTARLQKYRQTGLRRINAAGRRSKRLHNTGRLFR
jgi:hypothetical protein